MEREGLALVQYHIALFFLRKLTMIHQKQITLGRDFIATTGGTTNW